MKTRGCRGLVAILGYAAIAACTESPETMERAYLTDVMQPPGFALTVFETAPPGNELTEERAQLGRRLFFDTLLSRNQEIACASCHLPEHAFADSVPVSRGVSDRVGTRNTPHLVNLAWVRNGLFWDGRAPTLEALVGQPIENPVEMDFSLDEAVDRLTDQPAYVGAFEDAYGGPPTRDSLRMALASFVRTLVSAASPYDRFLAGDVAALNESARRGHATFFASVGGCFHCHTEHALSNDGFFNNGTFVEGGDVGRQAQTGRTGDLGKFRVPSLRNVAKTAPYMHDGSILTLEAVVDHYASGGRGHPSTDPQIEPLELDASERADLVAFLEALTDEGFLLDPRFRP